MTISYNWLSEYLPVKVEPEKLSDILTSIGLEVESMERVEDIKGGLAGLLVAEVVTCVKHPDADKLKVTTVNAGSGELLTIVCGASNVAAGQKVVLATTGTTIYPVNGEPFTIRKAKIRGVESHGMICAEDEIGIGHNHDGIIVLPADAVPGTPVAELYKPKQDIVFEIGLTPNRIDAMSHLGVARDVCAYLSHHRQQEISYLHPFQDNVQHDSTKQDIAVEIKDTDACRRYSALTISNIRIAESPEWLKSKLKSIGVKPISNIVDITNFILHETGQPLHAFDAEKIHGKKVIVRHADAGELFTTLDGKERKLFVDDLLIADVAGGMCMAGVYGGIHRGGTTETTPNFLESAWFNPASIRATSLKHDLRTDAAARFEKGTDISNTVQVLQRAAQLICEIAGGSIAGELIDIYPVPAKKTVVSLLYGYLEKLSGKKYPAAIVINILSGLGFKIVNESTDGLTVEVPYSKPDISLPADLVEEIMRIDGLDNIDIPKTISIAPSVEKNNEKYIVKEKLAGYFTGQGFYEIFTNSITNSRFYSNEVLQSAVKMINSLSNDLDIMRPMMLQGGLQVIAHNNNRKITSLRLFEFGKTYAASPGNTYSEINHLAIYASGHVSEQDWRSKPIKSDFYYLKAVVENILSLLGIKEAIFEPVSGNGLKNQAVIKVGKTIAGNIGEADEQTMKQFDLKIPVYFADLLWDDLLLLSAKNNIRYKEVPRFPAVIRDLSIVVEKNITYAQIKKLASSAGIQPLQSIQLFDIFESEKLGAGKKAMAVSFTFQDETKTLTDVAIDSFMQQIIAVYEKDLQATIRK